MNERKEEVGERAVFTLSRPPEYFYVIGERQLLVSSIS